MISVIICTHNRCESLRCTLDAMSRQVPASSRSIEIIVVDNNSGDGTPSVVAEATERSAYPVRYVFEGRQGLSVARNRGVEEARGEYVAFTDDDAVPDARWVQGLLRAFDAEKADCVFGKISPTWLLPDVPPWLEKDKNLWKMLALLDYGDAMREITTEHEQFYGANFAVRRSIVVDAKGFDPDLGVRGTTHSLGDDTDLFLRLRAMQRKIVYNPEAHVYHRISAERMDKKYFREWSFWGGVYSATRIQSSNRSFLGLPYWFLKEVITFLPKFFFSLFGKDRDQSFRNQLQLIHYRGAISTFLKKK